MSADTPTTPAAPATSKPAKKPVATKAPKAAKKPAAKGVSKSDEVRKLAAATKAKGEKPRPSVIVATLAKQGVECEVIDLRTLSPWDQETVFNSVKKTSRVIVATEDSLSWGYGAEIAAKIADECFAWLDAPVKRVASADAFVGYAPSLEDATLPQVETFRTAYLDIVRY